jgi:hypothetical protein
MLQKLKAVSRSKTLLNGVRHLNQQLTICRWYCKSVKLEYTRRVPAALV